MRSSTGVSDDPPNPNRNPRPSHDRLAATYSMVHVMSEVKRYVASWHMQEFYLRPDGDVVRFSDHLAALDAQRLRADTAEAERDAAEQRISEMTRALAGMLFAFDDGVGRDWSAPLLDYARKLTNAAEFDAALNPNPEAESHE